MSLKRWFYRDGHPNRVARTLEWGTAALHAQSRREVGTVTGTRLFRIGGLLEAVMNSIRNGLGMRETEIVKEPTRPWNPHFYAIFARVHNTL